MRKQTIGVPTRSDTNWAVVTEYGYRLDTVEELYCVAKTRALIS